MTTVHVIVPDSIDDPGQPSGGNIYDRRIIEGLRAGGWSVRVRAVPGSWPSPERKARAALASTVAAVPDGAIVLLDGLVASTMPEVLVPEAARLREVVLVHMPLGEDRPGREAVGTRAGEHAVLAAAAAVITTSSWSRSTLLDRYVLDPARLHVAEPGADRQPVAPGTACGGGLLCVAAVAPHKGHDVLLAALATITDLSWSCTCAGALTRDPRFVDLLAHRAGQDRIDDRLCFPGPMDGAALRGAYAAADVLVVASRSESYGMVVTEALAAALPVITTRAGGLPQALGRTPDGTLPGLLVPPGDARALAAALRRWLGDSQLRQQLRAAARERREALPDWSATTRQVARVLAKAAA